MLAECALSSMTLLEREASENAVECQQCASASISCVASAQELSGSLATLQTPHCARATKPALFFPCGSLDHFPPPKCYNYSVQLITAIATYYSHYCTSALHSFSLRPRQKSTFFSDFDFANVHYAQVSFIVVTAIQQLIQIIGIKGSV